MTEGIDQEERRRRLREQPIVSVEERGAAVVVRVGGELDLYNAPAVRERLLEICGTRPERVVLDFSEVEFMDSTVLGVLLEARSALGGGSRVLVASPGIETRRALQVSGLGRHLPMHDSVDAALAAEL